MHLNLLHAFFPFTCASYESQIIKFDVRQVDVLVVSAADQHPQGKHAAGAPGTTWCYVASWLQHQ